MLPIVINFLLAIHIIVSLLIVLLVLMQRPKNEGLGAAFGGGMTENLFGAQTTNVLQTITRWLGAIFFSLTLLLSWLYVKETAARSTVQQRLSQPTVIPATPAPALPQDIPTELKEALKNVKAESTTTTPPVKPEETPKSTEPAKPVEAPAAPAPEAKPAPAPEAAKPTETPKAEMPAAAPATPAVSAPAPTPEAAKPEAAPAPATPAAPAPEVPKAESTPAAPAPAAAPTAPAPAAEKAPEPAAPAPAKEQ